MKKTLSLLLAVLMATSVLSGLNFSAYAECLHTNTHTESKDATYYEDGYEDRIICDDCGETVDDGTVVPKLVGNKWTKVDGGKWMYFDESGNYATGLKKINNKWFYFNDEGIMQTGWQTVDGKKFYFNSNGNMQTGWQYIGGAWYYMNKYGVMQTGWQTINGKEYYFDSSGAWREGYCSVYEYYGSEYVNNYNRTQNLIIASSYIDGTILAPGEIFDFNDVVGPRTASRGYLPAPVFTGPTTHADEIGGGLCQVSSTVFNAALYANFEILERHQHSQRVYYVPLGRDAAMYQNVNNFRFRNTSGTYIKIGMTVEGGTITCTFYTQENVKPPSVSLDVTQSGNTFTLRRYANGECNYTTTSTY